VSHESCDVPDRVAAFVTGCRQTFPTSGVDGYGRQIGEFATRAGDDDVRSTTKRYAARRQTGAEGIKTAQEAAIWGGTAGIS
jgi:hypothetical protein